MSRKLSSLNLIQGEENSSVPRVSKDVIEHALSTLGP